jgi:ankyrin repeat protein
METRSKRRDAAESIVDKIQCGEISIFVALAEELPDVFAAEILPKLDAWTTLNLAQVSKSYRDAVWSVDGVRSMEAKIKAYLLKIGKSTITAAPMYWMARHGNLPAVRALLMDGVWINKIVNRRKWTGLHVATYYNRAALVKELIKAGADVNMQVTDVAIPGNSNYTALHCAASKCYTTIIMELIKGGADVNIASSDGTTPLHMAAEKGHEAGVVALMYAGADINAVMRDGHTPLSVAVHKKHERIVELLKHFGAVETRSPGL